VRILLGNNTGDGAVMLQPIRCQSLGVRIPDGLISVHIYSIVNHTYRNSDLIKFRLAPYLPERYNFATLEGLFYCYYVFSDIRIIPAVFINVTCCCKVTGRAEINKTYLFSADRPVTLQHAVTFMNTDGMIWLLYNGYRVSLPAVKRPGRGVIWRGVGHPPYLAPKLKEE